MSEKTTVLVPDIGDFDAVPVIEILVKVGDEVSIESPLVTLERVMPESGVWSS